MKKHIIALFGEAEKGQFQKPYRLKELGQLVDSLGNPPPESEGIAFAVQSLLYKREIIYFRVEEEGFSVLDYFQGFNQLLTAKGKEKKIHALCLPGVGGGKILNASEEVRQLYKSFLITNQKDLYDYLTDF
jgi:hypothetical protein